MLQIYNDTENHRPYSHFVFVLPIIIIITTIRDTMVYYWSLPRQFLGNKLGAYGGNLTFYQVPPIHSHLDGQYWKNVDVMQTDFLRRKEMNNQTFP